MANVDRSIETPNFIADALREQIRPLPSSQSSDEGSVGKIISK